MDQIKLEARLGGVVQNVNVPTHREPADVLVITDELSRDETPLYEDDARVRGGTSSLVIPLPFNVRTGDGALRVAATQDSAAVPAEDAEQLWAGELTFPSGRLFMSDWSMEPLERLELPPGRHHVVVTVTRDGWVRIGFTSD